MSDLIIYGAVILAIALVVFIIWGWFSIEKDRTAQIKKWHSLPKFKIYCDLMYKKQCPFIGGHLLPESLWYAPEFPVFGETSEEMKLRCDRYNQEKELTNV